MSLAFVDFDPLTPGEALVVGDGTGGWVLESGQAPLPLPNLGAPVTDAAAVDLDSDGAIDLALVTGSGLTVLYGFGTETVERVEVPAPGPLVRLEAFEPAQDVPGLVLQREDELVYTVEGTQQRVLNLAELDGSVLARDLGVYAHGDGATGFAVEPSTPTPPRVYTSPIGFYDLGEVARASNRALALGQLGGGGRSDALWSSVYLDWTFLEVSVDGGAPEPRAVYFTYPAYAIGDLDGNGLGDAIGVGPGGVVVLPGDDTWGVSCFVQGPLEGTPGPSDVGDFDGDGVDELAILPREGGGPTVFDVSWAP